MAKTSTEAPLVGFDFEWELQPPEQPSVDTALKKLTNKQRKEQAAKLRNRLLSFQFFGLKGDKSWQGIKYLDGQRLTLQEVVSIAIEAGVNAKVLKRRPTRIYLCSHYNIAEVSSLEDRDAVMSQLDYCKKCFSTFGKPIQVKYHDRHRNEHKVDIVFRDSWLMAPEGKKGLAVLGELIGVPKVDIGDYKKEEMSRLMKEDPALFERYGIVDAEITARYFQRMAQFAAERFGNNEPPPTIGSCAVTLALDTWEKQSICQHEVLGTTVKMEREQNSIGKMVQRFRTVPLEIRQDYESFARNAFAGGRNETFYFGPSPLGEYIDLDLCGAYNTALACLGMPLWNQLRSTTHVDDFTLDVIGFAKVAFEFPPETRFPCLPVRMKMGILFPLTGECYATAPEILLARKLGAQMVIRRGCVMPMDQTRHPFAMIAAVVTAERTHYQKVDGKSGLMDRFVKTMGNSIYGKLAQAIRSKKAYSTRVRAMEEIKPSRISNAFLAAAVTGIIRAVLGEILAAMPAETRVVSVTTDGCLADLPESAIPSVTGGPLCQFFAEGRKRISDDGAIVEIKHRARQVMSWRTRGQATLDCDDPKELILARAGMQMHDLNLEQQNEMIITKFMNRERGDEFVVKRLRSGKDICEEGGDLVGVEQVVRLGMDYDWKRLPIAPSTLNIKDSPHLCFDTSPLPHAVKFQQMRDAWEDFFARFGKPLKSVEDYEDFVEFCAIRDSGKLHVPVKGSAVFVARRGFLSAYAKSVWGFKCELANAELAHVLTEAGYATEVHEIENSRRKGAPLYPSSVAPTPSVLAFVAFVRQRFGGEPDRLLAEEWA
jgi:hypothetical protein